MKMSKLEKIFVNPSARMRNIKVMERLFNQIDLNNIKKMLEVGCGVGVLSSYLVEKYRWEVTGIDLDFDQIKKAKMNHQENKYLRFIKADAAKLTFRDNEFDLALSSDAFHHIPDWNKTLDEINRVLKPKGFFILNDIAFPGFSFFKKYSINVDDIINHLKRNNHKIIFKRKTKINIIGGRFSIISQKAPTK